MKRYLILAIMFLSTLFSCAQKAEYEIIYKNPMFYEFNQNRDKIFIYDYALNLSVYDVNTDQTTLIEAGVMAEISRNIKNPFIRTAEGKILFVAHSDLYEIKDNKLISIAKFVYDEYELNTHDDKKKEKEKLELEKLNRLVAEYKDDKLISYKKCIDVYVFNYADDHAVAMYGTRLEGLNLLEKENIAKIKRLAKPVENARDTSYFIKIKKDGSVINYFENKKLSIEEKSYSCKNEEPIRVITQCKYKIKVKYKNKAVTLKNEHRETRFSTWKDNYLNVDLNEYIPYSQYIADKNGNIYIFFDIEEKTKLIKIPVSQFETKQ